MIQQIIVGLVVSGVGGLTFLAYKHPALYKNLFYKLAFPIVGGFMGVNLTNLTSPYFELKGKLEYLNQNTELESLNIKSTEIAELVYMLGDFITYTGLIAAVCFYFFILCFVREIIEESEGGT
ncbi:hypothetical protein [Vibrio crassostreae]|uniref:hypothetical protein n=1 Tax=Vibrio crassostreae TaxID=246167 RepID=UPI001B301F4D|nr:hypothetical protein [Vibrio crassostreae]